jgi:hypothetical protein
MNEQRIWVSSDRCILVTMWESVADEPVVTVATRQNPAHTWGPPITLTEERS